NLEDHFEFDDVVDVERGYRVSGWIGTVDKQENIDDETNTIVVFAHGKLIHEDVLSDLKEGRVFTKYIIGEIDAEFMDDNEAEDIVTSARQSVKQNDPRYEALKDYVKRVLNQIGNRWTGLRNEVG